MIRRPPRSTRTDTLFPYTTLCRSGQYLPLVVLMVLAAVFGAGSLATSRLLAPQRKTVAKLAPYESGIVPTREQPERFPVKFYSVAMSFIVFDLEIIFLFPWATIYLQLGAFGQFAVLLFSAPIVLTSQERRVGKESVHT